MFGIIEKYAQTPVTIRKRVGIVEGKPEWEKFGGGGRTSSSSHVDE